ncbi:MAG TPA: ATP-binding protein [Myxococcaceae bacterium]|nr:ATP-binding protein [Myxococcaceae bacterium]
MSQPLRVLMVEDSEADAALLIRELRQVYEPRSERVETAAALRTALAGSWDIVLSDYHLPTFSAPEVIALVLEVKPDLPVVIVSGTIGETRAVEVMRAGARDFISKDALARLLPAIEREVTQARLRVDRRKMEQQLLISERMASLGAIAAGIGHEINNPLSSAATNLAFVLERVEGQASVEPKQIAEPLRDAHEALERMRRIVGDLKIFSRGDEQTRSAVDLRTVLESTLRIASNQLRHRAQVARELGAIPPVEANEARLGQVFLNLLVNAAEAIPDQPAGSGRIRVATGTDPDGNVYCEVGDNGSGISAEDLPRIFDSFFTTKPQGVGTGLGLAISQRIVTELGGRIDVQSTIGKGSTFRVVLPRARPATPHAKEAAPSPAAASRRGRVLVVDDELVLAKAIQRTLAAHHDVTALGSAAEAMKKLEAGERYDAIISDLMMPGMTGMDFHQAVLALEPALAERMIFTTGGVFSETARGFLTRVPNSRLEKPFDLDKLLELVNRLVH